MLLDYKKIFSVLESSYCLHPQSFYMISIFPPSLPFSPLSFISLSLSHSLSLFTSLFEFFCCFLGFCSCLSSFVQIFNLLLYRVGDFLTLFQHYLSFPIYRLLGRVRETRRGEGALSLFHNTWALFFLLKYSERSDYSSFGRSIKTLTSVRESHEHFY